MASPDEQVIAYSSCYCLSVRLASHSGPHSLRRGAGYDFLSADLRLRGNRRLHEGPISPEQQHGTAMIVSTLRNPRPPSKRGIGIATQRTGVQKGEKRDALSTACGLLRRTSSPRRSQSRAPGGHSRDTGSCSVDRASPSSQESSSDISLTRWVDHRSPAFSPPAHTTTTSHRPPGRPGRGR